MFDVHGDITTGGPQEQGLYHDGTRHLSRWQLRVAGRRPLMLSSTLGTASHVLTVDLTNPDIRVDDDQLWPEGIAAHPAHGLSLGGDVLHTRRAGQLRPLADGL